MLLAFMLPLLTAATAPPLCLIAHLSNMDDRIDNYAEFQVHFLEQFFLINTMFGYPAMCREQNVHHAPQTCFKIGVLCLKEAILTPKCVGMTCALHVSSLGSCEGEGIGP